jgi:hypothetical protein
MPTAGEAEFWVKLLYTYGPFALLVFFVIVVEIKTRKAMMQAPPGASRGTKLALLSVYLGNWVVVLGLVVVALIVFFRVNLPSEYMIVGTLEGLEGSEKVTSAEPVYLRRKYKADGKFDYAWRIITPHRLKEGGEFHLVFDAGDPNEEKVKEYKLVIRSNFYEKPVQMEYERSTDRLMLRLEDSIIPLRVHGEPHAVLGRPNAAQRRLVRSFFVGSLYAQEPFPRAEFIKRLKSDDAIIRRQGRADLAKRGREAVTWIKEVLLDGRSVYRLRLGVIVALNQMEDLDEESLGPSVIAVIRRLTEDPDRALSEQSRQLLRRFS